MAELRRSGTSALENLAARIGRHAVLYAGGSAAGLALALVNVAVLTRFLSPGEFGRLALALAFASLLTVLYNVGILQGASRAVFGSAGEDGAELDDDEGVLVADRAGALGTAVVLTVLVSLAGTLAISLAAGPFARLVHLGGDLGLVRWAAVSGGAGAVWRLLANVIRTERRPVAYLVCSTARPLLSVGAAVPLVATGGGPRGAMAGIAIGTLASLAIALVFARRSYRPTFDAALGLRVVRLGGSMVPVVVAFWIVQNADVWVLSHYVSSAEVGRYRVASRLGALFLYFNSAFMMAWGPLRREPLQLAVERERGAGAANATVALFYVLAALWVVLGIAATAPVLVHVAGPRFSGAVGLIPLTALAALAHGLFVVSYRTALFRTRRTMFIATAAGSPFAFVAVALALGPSLGAAGIALAVMIGQLGAAGVLLWRSQRSAEPVPYDWPRLAGGVALAAGCFGTSVLARRLPAPLDVIGELASVLAFPALAVALGVVPRAQLRALGRAVRALRPDRADAGELRSRLEQLPPRDFALVSLLLRHRSSPGRIGRLLGVTEQAVTARLVGVLRTLAPEAPAGAARADDMVAAYILHEGPVADRDALGRGLWEAGADPREVDVLTALVRRLRGSPPEAWPGAAPRRRGVSRLRGARSRGRATGAPAPGRELRTHGPSPGQDVERSPAAG